MLNQLHLSGQHLSYLAASVVNILVKVRQYKTMLSIAVDLSRQVSGSPIDVRPGSGCRRRLRLLHPAGRPAVDSSRHAVSFPSPPSPSRLRLQSPRRLRPSSRSIQQTEGGGGLSAAVAWTPVTAAPEHGFRGRLLATSGSRGGGSECWTVRDRTVSSRNLGLSHPSVAPCHATGRSGTGRDGTGRDMGGEPEKSLTTWV